MPEDELTPTELEKIAAETDKLRAEADATRKRLELETRKADLDSRKVEADIAKVVVETETQALVKRAAELELENATILTNRAKRDEELILNSDRFHHIVHFGSSITESSVNNCISMLTTWRRIDKDLEQKKCEIVFSSPGGSVIDGMRLFDYIQEMRRDGWYVTTSAIGWAASMAGILLQ